MKRYFTREKGHNLISQHYTCKLSIDIVYTLSFSIFFLNDIYIYNTSVILYL